MTRGRRASRSVASNPVLVGAVAVLVVVVAVFLSYNANSGLPFVPTYEVSVRLPDAAELVPGNDVRVGGSRVGAIAALDAVRTRDGAYAVARVQLEQRVGPLPSDTRVAVRQRSSLGLKYLELQPGRSRRTVPPGGSLGSVRAPAAVDLDDVFGAFDAPARTGVRRITRDLGVGLAGRGEALNRGLEQLPEVLGRLAPVARDLADRRTRLPAFLAEAAGTARAVAPVTPRFGTLLAGAAVTFDAIDGAGALDGLLRAAAADAAPITTALARTRPAVGDAAELLRRLEPAARRLPGAARAMGAGLARVVGPTARAAATVRAAVPTLTEGRRLVRDPRTSTALRQLSGLASELAPAAEFIAPLQVRCNYLGLWLRNVPAFISEGDALGTWFRALPVVAPDEMLARSTPAPLLHADYYPDAGQDGTCEAGNTPYLRGRQVIGASGLRAPAFTEPTSRPREVLGR